jgi:CRP-like cAMP-binding protein
MSWRTTHWRDDSTTRGSATDADGDSSTESAVSTISLLRAMELFEDVSEAALAELAHAFVQRSARPGDTLDVQERRVRRWYLIVDGHALVMRDGTPLGLLGHGESWSEHSLLNDQRSPITVVALSPMRLLSLSARDFFDLSESQPVVSRRIMISSATSADRLALPVYRALFHMEAADRRLLDRRSGVT